MWSSRLFWKLFLLYAGLSLVFVVVFLIVVTSRQQQLIYKQLDDRLHDAAIIIRRHLTAELEAGGANPQIRNVIDSAVEGTTLRVTVIDREGRAIADTSDVDLAKIPKLNGRAELAQARGSGVGGNRRHSDTLDVAMAYYAVKLETGSARPAFLRVAAPLDELNAKSFEVLRFSLVLTCVFGVLTMGVTWVVVRRILQPLESLYQSTKAFRSEPVVQFRGADEITELTHSFADMQRKMTDRLEQLRDNSEQLSTILGSMVEGVLAVDADQRILMANDASRRLLDFSSPEVVGRPLLEATRARVVREAIDATFNTLSPREKEFETSGQVRRVLSLRATPLPGAPCPGVVVVLHDVSEVRRLENVRQEFMANVSHELKTPLASVKAYAETLRLGAINDPQNNLMFVGRIEEQSERLNQLIQDLLQIARVESGQQAFDVANVRLADVVSKCVEAHRAEAESAGILLDLEATIPDVQVLVDEDGLRTIVDNLITNAIKYTPEGGTISVHWDLEKERACLTVADTGIGIAEEHLDRVFERFYRVDKARSRELGGTGLGLSIVKHLTQAFGGSVGVSSVLGQGSRFEIRIPLSVEADQRGI